MGHDGSTTRREVLALTGGAALAAVAGCVSSPASGGGGTEPDTTGGGTTGTGDGTTGDPDHSHHDGHHHEDVPDGPSDHVEVKMITTDDGDYHFQPHVAWVAEGGTVTFVNESGAHTATAYHPDNDRPLRIPESADAFDTGTLSERGATVEFTFDTAGVYDYYCAPHERLGMVASLIVGEPDAHDQPGLSAPGDELPDAVATKVEGLNGTADEALGHGHEEDGSDDHEETTSHDDDQGDDHGDDGHHDEETTSHDDDHGDDGHHDEETTTHGDDGHHDEETTTHGDDGHHDEETTTHGDGHGDDGHHDE